MEVVFILIPVSIVIIYFVIASFMWSVESDQYENLDEEAKKILRD